MEKIRTIILRLPESAFKIIEKKKNEVMKNLNLNKLTWEEFIYKRAVMEK